MKCFKLNVPKYRELSFAAKAPFTRVHLFCVFVVRFYTAFCDAFSSQNSLLIIYTAFKVGVDA
jgi:hypothetical protein